MYIYVYGKWTVQHQNNFSILFLRSVRLSKILYNIIIIDFNVIISRDGCMYGLNRLTFKLLKVGDDILYVGTLQLKRTIDFESEKSCST